MKFGIRKIGCSMSWTNRKNIICNLWIVAKKNCSKKKFRNSCILYMNLCHLGILLPAAFEIKNDVNVWDQRIDNFLTILWQSHKWNWQFSDSSKRIDDKDLWASGLFMTLTSKVEKILKDSLDLTPSPSPSVKIQIMCGKVGLRCKGKTKNVNVHDSLKVMGSNPDYLLKSSLLYVYIKFFQPYCLTRFFFQS